MEREHNIEIHPNFFLWDCVQHAKNENETLVSFLLVVRKSVEVFLPLMH